MNDFYRRPMRIGEIMRTMGMQSDEALFARQGENAKRAYADYLRENQTTSERMMARALFYLGCDVEPQQVVLGWVVDFLDRANKVVIEVDGSSHTGKEDADDFRDEKMREAGYRVIRIESWEVPHIMQRVAAWREKAA